MSDPSERHREAAKTRLADLAGLAARSDDCDRAILGAAHERLKAVDADLSRLRPRAIQDEAVGEQYQRLMVERGQLAMVLSRNSPLPFSDN